MSYQREREEFLVTIATNGLPIYQARKVLAMANTLQRIAELSCSSEAADRDRVKCPADPARKFGKGECICDLYICDCSHSINSHEVDDGGCRSCDCLMFRGSHSDVPRIDVQERRVMRRMTALLEPYKLTPVFQGDPRGAVCSVKRADQAENDRGICVPSKGLPASFWSRAA